jgi:hypothetical protein
MNTRPRQCNRSQVARKGALVRVTWTWPAVFALAMLSGISLRAADYWVANGGSNADGRGTQARPWATLQYAADHVNPGDTVYVRDGDYQGFDLRRGGTKVAPVQFKAEGKRARIVRRSRETPDGINVEGAGHVVIEGFIVNGMPRAAIRAVGGAGLTIRGNHADRNGTWGILVAHCDDALITGNETSNSAKQHGIYVANSGDRPVVIGNVARGNRQCGIHMNGDLSNGGDGIISGARVENNVIFDNGRGGGSGINCDGVQDSVFRNNLLYDNHASGISLFRIDGGGASKNNQVIHNTISMPGDGRWALNIVNESTGNLAVNNILLNSHRARGSITIDAASMPGFRSDYNIVVDRFSPDDGERVMTWKEWGSATGLDLHSIVAAPVSLFVSFSQRDFHLKHKSPAVDAADPSLAPPADLDGRPRPFGARPDIGALERSNDAGTAR